MVQAPLEKTHPVCKLAQKWCHDTQHNDTENNDYQHNNGKGKTHLNMMLDTECY
jgi:hypothetical protein